MTMPVPPHDDNPAYVDPVTGQPLYINPATGELSYSDPTSSAMPTVAHPAAGYAPPGYPTDRGIPQADFTTPPYSPVGYAQSAYGYPGFTGYPVGMVGIQNRTNPLAITSMVLSIAGFLGLACYGVGGIVLGIPCVIFGYIGRRQIRDRGEAGSGMTVAGLIIGWIDIVLGIAIVVLLIYTVRELSQSENDIQ